MFVFAATCGASLRAQTAGSPDYSFAGSVNGGQDTVFAAALQPDGRVVVAGNFTAVGTYPTTTSASNIARLNADGTVDTSFNAGSGANDTVYCVVIQPDGKIVVGGNFTAFNGQAQAFLCRLNADGSVDSSFAPGIQGGAVLSIALQTNGKIVVAGGFTSVTGSAQGRITRLNAGGTLDNSFSSTTTTNGQIISMVVQPDGNILICGLFTTVNVATANRIARLSSTGLIDGTFNPGTGANSSVSCLALQSDGKVVLAGSFTTINGTSRSGIARLSSTGTLESTTTFNPGTAANGTINAMSLQTDGKIILGGGFTHFNGVPTGNLARISGSGVVETSSTFNPASFIVMSVNSVTLQGDGRSLVGGLLNFLGNGLARLTNSTVAQTLSTPNSSLAQWMRSGACPEVWNTTLELSTDQGNSWNSLGAAMRMSGGWQLTGLSLPASGLLRARAQATAGFSNGADSLIEQVAAFGAASPAPVANTLGSAPSVTNNAPYFPSVIYGATLNGSVNPLGNSTTVSFQYGPTAAYGSTLTIPSPVAGSSLLPVSAAISNLSANTTYHYCIQATSSAGTSMGNDATFTTPNNNASLSSLSLVGATLFPPFNPSFPSFISYSTILPSNTTTATVNFTTADSNATVNANGAALPAGATSAAVFLVPGNNAIPLIVTAQDGISAAEHPQCPRDDFAHRRDRAL